GCSWSGTRPTPRAPRSGISSPRWKSWARPALTSRSVRLRPTSTSRARSCGPRKSFTCTATRWPTACVASRSCWRWISTIRISGRPSSSHVARGCWTSGGFLGRGRGSGATGGGIGVPGQVKGRPDGLLAGAQDGPSPGDRERAYDLQAVARLGLGILCRHGGRRARLVGDHADQPAGLKAPAKLDAPAPGIARVIPRGGGCSVLDRVGGQLGCDNDGVLDQPFQLPPAQGRHGKLTGGPGRLGYGGKPEALPRG